MVRLAFLGVGNMAGAIINGLLGSVGEPDGIEINLFDKLPSQCEVYRGRGPRIMHTAADAAADADYIFLSVKPQQMEELFSFLDGVPTEGKIFVSIAAGVPISRIVSLAGYEAAVIRTMPNTPLMIAKGFTALTRNSYVPDDNFEFIRGIFGSLGQTIVIEESDMNAIVSVNASSPAYVYLFIKAICDGAAAQGFNRDAMLPLVCMMVEGSAQMLRESGKTPEELIAVVASKGGTTEAALAKFGELGFADAVREAMIACTNRANEL